MVCPSKKNILLHLHSIDSCSLFSHVPPASLQQHSPWVSLPTRRTLFHPWRNRSIPVFSIFQPAVAQGRFLCMRPLGHSWHKHPFQTPTNLIFSPFLLSNFFFFFFSLRSPSTNSKDIKRLYHSIFLFLFSFLSLLSHQYHKRSSQLHSSPTFIVSCPLAFVYNSYRVHIHIHTLYTLQNSRDEPIQFSPSKRKKNQLYSSWHQLPFIPSLRNVSPRNHQRCLRLRCDPNRF